MSKGILYKQGKDILRVANETWYRGDTCNFIANKVNLQEERALDKYVLYGWMPDKPFIDKKTKKEQIRKRDNYRCQECFRHQDELRTKTNRKYKLLIYHIDYNKKNSVPNNLVSLCRSCYTKTNYNREKRNKNWINYYKNKELKCAS